MIVKLILSILFLSSLAFTILNIKRVIETKREFRALIYHSDIVQFFLSSSMLFFALLSIFILFFCSWKLFLLLGLLSFIIGTNRFLLLSEKTLFFIINKLTKEN